MRPNIFVSSTIQDLQYLREAIRDTILSLGYNPVMSEFGDIGYLPALSVEDACYLSLKDCQIAILIVGKKYGNISINGLSITHNEFKVARDNKIPVIFLVDRDIIAYKRVFDKQMLDKNLGSFPDMDNPEKTFNLLQEFIDYPVNNGFLSYSSAQEANENIKKQLAHIFGNILRDRYDPLKVQVQDVLSEIKTLRHELFKEDENKSDYLPYLLAIRFLIDEDNKVLSDFISRILRSVDEAVPDILAQKTFGKFIKSINWKIEIKDWPDILRDPENLQAQLYSYGSTHHTRKFPEEFDPESKQLISWGVNSKTKIIYLNSLTKKYFDWKFNELQRELLK
ncbi:MAG: DUF4062 domain-containing protein [Bacteroidales bacterium]|jgi:hypothetical protein